MQKCNRLYNLEMIELKKCNFTSCQARAKERHSPSTDGEAKARRNNRCCWGEMVAEPSWCRLSLCPCERGSFISKSVTLLLLVTCCVACCCDNSSIDHSPVTGRGREGPFFGQFYPLFPLLSPLLFPFLSSLCLILHRLRLLGCASLVHFAHTSSQKGAERSRKKTRKHRHKKAAVASHNFRFLQNWPLFNTRSLGKFAQGTATAIRCLLLSAMQGKVAWVWWRWTIGQQVSQIYLWLRQHFASHQLQKHWWSSWCVSNESADAPNVSTQWRRQSLG